MKSQTLLSLLFLTIITNCTKEKTALPDYSSALSNIGYNALQSVREYKEKSEDLVEIFQQFKNNPSQQNLENLRKEWLEFKVIQQYHFVNTVVKNGVYENDTTKSNWHVSSFSIDTLLSDTFNFDTLSSSKINNSFKVPMAIEYLLFGQNTQKSAISFTIEKR
jgi:hypothetical protein